MSSKKVKLIIDDTAEAGALETLPKIDSVELIKKHELQNNDYHFNPDDKVCLTSEAVIEDVLSCLDDERKKYAVSVMKDKSLFREMMQNDYPEFYFRKVSKGELTGISFDTAKKYVIKPLKGCFGTGVRVITGESDLAKLVKEVEPEIEKNAAVLSDSVLTKNYFLIEEFVEGDEYAVDMYYDSEGIPKITGIYHHPIPDNSAYLHMIYYLSREVFMKLYNPAKEFFTRLNKHLKVKNFPIHAEFRLNGDNLFPVELNPLRFGGMGLCNLSHYALGFNSYKCYAEDREPDWKILWRDKADDIFAFFIAYNGRSVNLNTQRPDWNRFRKLFSEIILETHLDFRNQLAFGIIFIRESMHNLPRLLNTEFDDYFIPDENLADAEKIHQ